MVCAQGHPTAEPTSVGEKKERKKGTSEPNPAESLLAHVTLFRASKP